MDSHPQTTPEPSKSLPLTAKIAAVYFLIVGITSVPLLFVAPSPEFLAQSAARRAGHYTREIMLDAAFVVAGIAVLRQRKWARKLGVIVLVISAIYGAFAFAGGFARATPTPQLLLVSFLVTGAWNALWIYLLCRKPRRDITPDA